MAFNNIYFGKKVLITGSTGFKGSWLSTWLIKLGAKVYGYSIDIPTNPSMFETLKLSEKINNCFADIRNIEMMDKCIQDVKPDFIFHLAAQAIVSRSYKEPFETITTNAIGTASILEAIKKIKWECTCVLITSDKVYDNVEWIWGYRENDTLGGKDIYSGSKGAAELIIKSYWKSFISKLPNIKLGIARAGNVIGGGDWAEDRIVVDCIKAFSSGSTVEIRSPKSTRPWQHVLEPISGYLNLGWYLHENICENGEAYNFGPRADQMKTVFELAQDLAIQWGLNKDISVKLTDNLTFNEASLLKLNCDKALAYLNWHSSLKYEQCVTYISEWYKTYYLNEQVDMYALTSKQIEDYINNSKNENLKWAL